MSFNNWPAVPYTGVQNFYSPAPMDYLNNGANTNVTKVATIDEAIIKSNVRPSENVYFHQSKPEFYNVRVDINGNKSWQTFVYDVQKVETPAQTTQTMPQISKVDFDELVKRVTALEAVKHTEVTENGKLDG